MPASTTPPPSAPSPAAPAAADTAARAAEAPSLEASLELRRQPLVEAPEGRRPPVSVVILTFNEQVNIKDCLRSCAWCDDVHVLDSGSTDRTIELAQSLGAKVHTNPFKSFGDQRNWAIDNIPCRHPWHFHLDADERFTPELVEEMFDLLGADGNSSDKAAYLCPSKMMLLGRWLKHSGGYPSYQVRLFRFGKCRYKDFGHGQREDPIGAVGTLVQPYTHYNFSKGVLEWFYKHNDYSGREADEAVAVIKTGGRPRLRQLFKGDATARRRAWKNMSYFLRGRAIIRFFYNFILRGGIFDGMAGLHYCAMISTYEYWTELKIVEKAKPWGPKTQRLTEKMLREDGVTR
ncbi:MAG: glycosyltransferase family 2 protein [Phycisphaerales bacterium]|nr:glycosyltransferase family 2 protein [Phycisphaerales bacterium]